MISELAPALRRLAAALTALTMFASAAATAAPRVLVMGAVHDNPNQHYAALKPIADYVAEALAPQGIASVEIIIVPNRSQMLNLVRDGRVDWISETAFGAAHLAERTGARFIARRWKDGTPDYRSLFFVRRDSGIESLDDLVDRTVAFEHRNSTSAFFVPATMLSERGQPLHALASPRETPAAGSFGYVFSGAEYNTAVWVAKGLVDAGVLSESNWRDSETVPREFLDQLDIIAVSEPMPRAVEIVRDDLDAGLVNALRDALFAMHDDEEAQRALAAYDNTARFDALSDVDIEMLDRVAGTLPAFREQFP